MAKSSKKQKKPRAKQRAAADDRQQEAQQSDAVAARDRGTGGQPSPSGSQKKTDAPKGKPVAAPLTDQTQAPITGHYLRVEGLNIEAGVLDTNQISVVRGAGLLLRQAAKDAAKQIEQAGGKVISTGASIGEFRLDTKDPDEAERIAGQIQHDLSVGEFAHLSFAVVAEPIGQAPGAKAPLAKAVRERALARIRFEQMRMPTLVPPAQHTATDREACGWEGRRPADAKQPIERSDADGPKKTYLSQSVRERYDYGVKQKQRFYREETGRPDDQARYTHDLNDIADLRSAKNLDGKIAVIYADGNRFSAIRDRACAGFGDLETFDKLVQAKRRAFLVALLERIAHDPVFNTPDARRRLETLLWGGDELILVVPAWRGLDVLQDFFIAMAGAQIKAKKPDKHAKVKQSTDPWPLTHAAGIVFCRAKTPIQRIQNLARQLADGVKGRLKQEAKGDTPEARLRSSLDNAWDYAVLESVDFPTEAELGDYFQGRYGAASGGRRVLQPRLHWRAEGAAGGVTRAEVAGLLDELPKGQVYAVARAAVAPNIDWTKTKSAQGFIAAHERMREVVGGADFDRLAPSVHKLFGSSGLIEPPVADAPIPDPWPWIHLAELWDYLAPNPNPSQNPGQNPEAEPEADSKPAPASTDGAAAADQGGAR